MPFTVVSASGKLPVWVKEGCDNYEKRLPGDYAIQWIDLPLSSRSKKRSSANTKKVETERLVNAIPRKSFVIALDERGEALTTRDLSGRIALNLQRHSRLCFVIGGPDGLDFDVKKASAGNAGWADFVWSLSPLTFPHTVVRLLLPEQLYRAWSVNAGHPYHRD